MASTQTAEPAHTPPVTRLANSPSPTQKSPAPSPGRVPPHSIEAERGVLACLLLEPTETIPIVIQLLKEPVDAFFDRRHQALCSILIAMFDENVPIDLITVAEKLLDTNRTEETGGIEYVAGLGDAAPSSANLEFYLKILIEQANLRRLIKVCSKAIEIAYDSPENVEKAIDDIEKNVFSITQPGGLTANRSIRDLVEEAISTLGKWQKSDSYMTGISTGYPDLDKLTHGFHSGELIVIAARPSMGKTSLAMNIVEHVCLNRHGPEQSGNVAVFSLEMTGDSLVLRMVCSRAELNMSEARSGFLGKEDFPRVTNAAKELSNTNLHIDDTPALSILELRSRARRMKQQHNIDLIVVDYLQLLRSTSRRAENRQQEIADISGGLKALAKELNVPVIVLSQLNREVERREGKPKLSDLRESGAIEQDADFVGLLYIPEEAQDAVDSGADHHTVNLLIAKQRNGPTGVVPLTFRKIFTRFESAAKFDPSDMPRGGSYQE